MINRQQFNVLGRNPSKVNIHLMYLCIAILARDQE